MYELYLVRVKLQQPVNLFRIKYNDYLTWLDSVHFFSAGTGYLTVPEIECKLF